MKTLMTTLVLFAISTISVAQYQVGVPVSDTIHFGIYLGPGTCSPLVDVRLEVDEILKNNYVSGIELVAVITAINIPNGELSTESTAVVVGDIFPMSAADPEFYPFSISSYGNFEFVIIAQGIPEIAGEEYPCTIIGLHTEALCSNGYIIMSDFATEICQVEAGATNSTDPFSQRSGLDIYPNPSFGLFGIRNISAAPIRKIDVFDQYGKLVLTLDDVKTQMYTEIDLSLFASGVYEVRVKRESGAEREVEWGRVVKL